MRENVGPSLLDCFETALLFCVAEFPALDSFLRLVDSIEHLRHVREIAVEERIGRIVRVFQELPGLLWIRLRELLDAQIHPFRLCRVADEPLLRIVAIVRKAQVPASERAEVNVLEKAIVSERKAVDRAPENADYRMTLANLLLELGRDKEAMDALQPLEGGRNPAYLLLADWSKLPLPAGDDLEEQLRHAGLPPGWGR